MNETIIALENAIQLLKKTRLDAYASISNTGITKIFHASYALENQLIALIEDL